jgi:hypothetical protein
MADPTTLLGFATLQSTNFNAALAKAQTNLTAAQTNYTAATQARDATNAVLSSIVTGMASLRTQLAAAVTPEDITDLQQKFQAAINQSRQQTGVLAWKQRAVAVTKAAVDAATAEVRRITTALAASSTSLASAQADNTKRTGLKAMLASAPLSTIKTDAAAILAATTFLDPANKFKFTDAQTRIQGDLPAALLKEAEQRLTDETTRSQASAQSYVQAQQQVETQWTSDLGVNGSVLAQRSAFDRAESAFTDFVTTAAARFQQAKTGLASVADPTFSPLTPTQKASINDAGTVATAQAAAAKEQAVDDAVANLAQKQEALEQAIRAAEAKNIDADPSTDPGVATATSDVNTAKSQLDAAKAAFISVQAGLTAWGVLVPDSEWQVLWSYEFGQQILNWLQSTDGTALQTAMDSAEQSLVTALLAADKSLRTLVTLKADATLHSAVATYETSSAEARRFSALRGDF